MSQQVVVPQQPHPLRGALPADPIGARELAHAARSGCERLQSVVLAHMDPATAMAVVYQKPVREGLSTFEMDIGNRWDRFVYENAAARILAELRNHGRFTVLDVKVVNLADEFPAKKNGGHLRRREQRTLQYLRMKLQGHPDAPNLIVKPRLAVHLGNGESVTIEPDHLVASDQDVFYRVGETKSYANRAGKTEDNEIAGALEQGAVGVYALRQAIAGMPRYLAGRDPVDLVPARVDLVMTRPGRFVLSITDQDARREVFVVTRALDQMRRQLPVLTARLQGGTLDEAATLDSLPANYTERCKEHCPMAPKCRRDAWRNGDPAIFGRTTRELLAACGSVDRAIALRDGRGPRPRNAAEAQLQRQLQRAHAERRRAV